MSIDGQGALVGMGVGVGGFALGAGVATGADRIYRAKFGELKSTLEALGPMSAEEWLGRIERFDRTVGAPTSALRKTGVIVGLGSLVVGGAILGNALLGGDD